MSHTMTQTKQTEDLSVKGTAIILPEANTGESAYGNERFIEWLLTINYTLESWKKFFH